MVNLRQEYTVIGRSSNCDVMVENHTDVSREHCGLRRYTDGTFTVTDFGSRNGTYVNEQQIFAEAKIKHGDNIRLCKDLEFIFEQPEARGGVGEETHDNLEKQAIVRNSPTSISGLAAAIPEPAVAPAALPPTATRKRHLPPEAKVPAEPEPVKELSDAIKDVQDAREDHGFRTLMIDLAEKARLKQTRQRPPKGGAESGETPTKGAPKG